MDWRDSIRFHVIAWLKILLPLAALGLLATLFMFSRTIDPTAVEPITDLDLRQRAKDEQMTAPVFAGASDAGDLVRLTADAARPDSETPGRMVVDAPRAHMTMVSGGRIDLRANTGVFMLSESRGSLAGSAFLSSSAGYRVWTERLDMALREIRVESHTPIEGEGPPGRFTAGRMLITAEPDGTGVQLLFTDGVKLVYEPDR
jgi:lipopolysaccharide export system protein LptC